MPDEPSPPTDGDAVDESTASDDAARGPTREAIDIPEWVSEVRRLYVEPKTRATLREEGEPSRYRRLTGIRPSRRSAPAAPDPTTPPTAEVPAPAAPVEPEHLSPERLAAAMGIPNPPPLTPAGPTSPSETPGPAVATEPATTSSAVARSAAPDTPLAEVAVRDEPGTTHSAAPGSIQDDGAVVVHDPPGSSVTVAPAPGPATAASSASSLSQPWIPPTWTSPSSSSGRDRGSGTSDAPPEPVTPIETGSALARFADSAEARRAEPDAEAEDPVIEPVATTAAPSPPPPAAAPPVAVTAVDSEPVAAQVVEPTPVEVVEHAAPSPVVEVDAAHVPVPVPVVEVGVEGDPVVVAEPVAEPEAPPRDAGPGRPSTVPAVHLSWREADSLHLGVPSVDDSFDAIVLEPPSQLVADTRRRPQRRRTEDAEDTAIRAPIEAAEHEEIMPGDDAHASPSLAADGDAPVRRARLGRGLAVVGAVLVLLVVGWLVLRSTDSDSAAPGMRPGLTVSEAASASGPGPRLLTT